MHYVYLSLSKIPNFFPSTARYFVLEMNYTFIEAAQRLTGCEYAKHIQPKKESTENSEDLAQLVTELCSLLKITPHPDPMVSLEVGFLLV